MKESDFAEKQLSSKLIYDGVIIHVYRDEVELPNGVKAAREIIRHNGAVCVIPVTENREVVCVRQYRYPYDGTLIEIPAGKLNTKDEDHREAAIRELREETGLSAGNLRYIGKMYGSPAILGETIYMYIATELSAGQMDPDEDEIIDPCIIPLDKLVDMVMNGEIPDAKTQIAVLKAAKILSSGEFKDIKEE